MTKKATEHLSAFMSELGLADWDDPNLQETPERMTRMYKEFTSSQGLLFPEKDWKLFPNDKGYDQIVLIRNIRFVSLCSHHFLPFTGLGHIAYIPNDLYIGASKPGRVLCFYGKKPNLQEDLCQQVCEEFEKHVRPYWVMVYLKASHGCMTDRGANQPEAEMITSCILGPRKDDSMLELKTLFMINMR